MTLIIDAYNVLHATEALPPGVFAPDEVALARLVAASRWGGDAATIVCDGTGSGRASRTPGEVRGVRILYAGAGRDADSVIIAMIERDTSPRKLTVVSSDRAIQKAARRRRASAISSEDFLRTLAPAAPKAPAPQTSGMRAAVPLDPHGVARWMREFGYDPADIADSAGAATGVRRPIAKPEAGAEGATDKVAGPNRDSTGTRRAPSRQKHTPDRPAARAERRQPPATSHTPNDTPPASPGRTLPKGDADPVLDTLLRDWASSVDRADLDMRKWINGVEPI